MVSRVITPAGYSRFHQILSGMLPKRYDGGVLMNLPGDQHTQMIMRGSLRGVEEPETANTRDLEADDIVIAYVIKVFQEKKKFDSMFSSVMGPTGSGKSTVRRTTSRIISSFISPSVRVRCEWT